ncbi:GCK domain-containing protein [Quillaja saponaria]|uniref:GCK domain-containing protein n=1 Tax=Quillaja saponaria TaxID=32244 RepID=A0AAD7KPU7_QUISA|nr:GCK domain-containing protein [Quillaja saponaria]KAJ7943429.1 GCK domain-containing protein [Quillaja saponaria]
MGGMISSPSPNPSDVHVVNSPSPNSTIHSNSHKPESSPKSANAKMSTSDSKPTESESNSPQTQTSLQQSDTVIVTKVEENDSDQSILVADNAREGDGDGGGGGDGDEEGEGEGEGVGECGFCLFMKAGGCQDSFIAWEQCVEAAEKNEEDIVEKCGEVTGALKKCMEAHADFYEPILRAEKAAEVEAVKELEKEKEAASQSLKISRENEGIKDSEQQQASNDN